MKLQYIQHPQDESADATVHLQLAPSYVTYNAVAVQRAMEFFRTEEVRGLRQRSHCISKKMLCNMHFSAKSTPTTY